MQFLLYSKVMAKGAGMPVKISPYIWPNEYVLGMLHPVIRAWFTSKYASFTDVQRRAIPLIHRGKSVLMMSPTGSGKTLAAFMSAINELFILASEGRLENKVYVVYVSPLRALSNDIKRNLEEPIEGIKEIAEELGIEIPEIRYLVRTGDTKQSERAKMLKKAPHILITTPETFAIVITSPKFRQLMKDVKYIIVDEIHELCSSKRGVHLSLAMERLQEYVGKPIVRIGMSATQAPIEEIAKFLAGGEVVGGKWTPRDVYIVKSSFQKDIDILVHSPGDLVKEGPEVVNARMYELLRRYIEDHRTTLVFTNTRSGAEAVSYKLKEVGVEGVGTHHSSLSPEVRLKVEEDLKKGRLKAVVTSTSLELGIDIGYVDLVCEIGSPKSISRGIQRIGRSGHAISATPKGRFIAINRGDLIECAVIAKCAKMGKIDRVRIPENSLDVLAQHIVGMSLERKWGIDEAYRVVRRAYPYRNLPYEEFLLVLKYLGGEYKELESLNVYRKIWVDFEEGVFGRKKGSRVIYNLNVGTIPEETKYAVVLRDQRRVVGYLSEDFAMELKSGDIFVLAGTTYEFLGFKGTKIYVREAPGRRPTIPSWVGEMLPRSYDLSIEVLKFRERLEREIREYLVGKKTKKDVLDFLMREYYLDHRAAEVLFEFSLDQVLFSGYIPSFQNLVIEHYRESSRRNHIVFHFPFGRKVNDALSRAYAAAMASQYGINVRVTVTDDGFMLTTEEPVYLSEEDVTRLVTPESIEEILKASIRNTELFNQKFRHCAVRAFMILRNYKGHEISAKSQYIKAMMLLEASKKFEEGHPIFMETYREILTQHMDVDGAKEVLKNISSGLWRVRVLPPTETPMPFSHEIIASGYEDVVLMEDRALVLRRLLQRIKTRIAEKEVEFKDLDYLENYYKLKRGLIIKGLRKEDLLELLERVGFIPLTGSENIYERFMVSERTLRRWINELIEEGAVSIISPRRRRYITLKKYEKFFSILLKRPKEVDMEEVERLISSWNEGKRDKDALRRISQLESMGVVEVYKLTERGIPLFRMKKPIKDKVSPVEAYKFVITKLLYSHGPLTVDEIRVKLRAPEEHTEHIKRALTELEQNGIIVRGLFRAFDEVQYMLRSDYEVLKRRPILEHAVLRYILEKSSSRDHARAHSNTVSYKIINALKQSIMEQKTSVLMVNRRGEIEEVSLNIRACDLLRDLERDVDDIIGIIGPGDSIGGIFTGYRDDLHNLVAGRCVIAHLKDGALTPAEGVDESTIRYVIERLKSKTGAEKCTKMLNMEDLSSVSKDISR